MSLRSFAFALAFSSLLAAGTAFAGSTAAGDTASTVTLFANFSSDAVGAPPDVALPGPPTGDALSLSQVAGTVTVDASIDGLTMAAMMKQQSGAGGVGLLAFPAAAPAGAERVTLGWRSVAQDDNPGTIVACTMRASNGNLIASVEYGSHGSLTWDATSGAGQTLPITYRQNRNNQFTLVVDLLAQRVSLTVDGAPVAGFQNMPFAQPASDVARLGFEGLGTSPQGFAVDDLFVVVFARTPNRAPIVSAPISVAVEELGHLEFEVTATDPDGDAITGLTADLSQLPAASGASFTSSADHASGTFAWTPALGSAGVYDVVFTTASNGLTGSATTRVFTAALGTAVTGRFIWTPNPGDEGTWSVTFTATDAGGVTTQTVPLTVLPVGGSLAAPAPNAVTPALRLAPQAPMKGPIIYVTGTASTTPGKNVTLTATATTDGSALAGRFSVERTGSVAGAATQGPITLSADLTGLPPVNDAVFIVDQDPRVFAPVNVNGEAGTPLTVNVGVEDPDADPILDLTADTSGLPSGNNAAFTANASHTLGTLTWTPTYSDVGDFTVTFTASNRLVGSGSTAIHVHGAAPARIFVTGSRKVNLASGKPFYTIQIEPVNGSFNLTDIDFASILMISTGTGSVSQISAATQKQVILGDRDNNLIPDLSVSFQKADLRALFSLLRGNTTVPVVIQGDLQSGGRFRGTLSVDLQAGGGKLAASVLPNPLNPSGTLRFVTTRPGEVRVRLFNVSGRMVREIMPQSYLAAGEHQVTIRSEDGAGRQLASGVYFYRVEAVEGFSIGRVAVVK